MFVSLCMSPNVCVWVYATVRVHGFGRLYAGVYLFVCVFTKVFVGLCGYGGILVRICVCVCVCWFRCFCVSAKSEGI